MPYRYFPIIIKDIGTAWQGQETLPEADFFVLVCGGKWWETARTLEMCIRDRSIPLEWTERENGNTIGF